MEPGPILLSFIKWDGDILQKMEIMGPEIMEPGPNLKMEIMVNNGAWHHFCLCFYFFLLKYS